MNFKKIIWDLIFLSGRWYEHKTLLCIFQVLAGVLLILDHRVRVKTQKDLRKGTQYTDAITFCMLLVTVLNVLFKSFDGKVEPKKEM